MRSVTIRRYIKFLPSFAAAILAIAIISWAIIQEPVEPQELTLPQGSQIPLYIPPTSDS
jgi:hypothetical protein